MTALVRIDDGRGAVFVLPSEVLRRRNATDVAARRNAEAACALDFLVYADDGPRGPHAPRCDHTLAGRDACARVYDPQPYPEAVPDAAYEGTGIGALYGLPGCESHAWRLDGWNLDPRSTR